MPAPIGQWSTLQANLTFRRDVLFSYDYMLYSKGRDTLHISAITEVGMTDALGQAVAASMKAPQMGYWSDAILTSSTDITAAKVGTGLGILVSNGQSRLLLWPSDRYRGLLHVVSNGVTSQHLVSSSESIR